MNVSVGSGSKSNVANKLVCPVTVCDVVFDISETGVYTVLIRTGLVICIVIYKHVYCNLLFTVYLNEKYIPACNNMFSLK